MQIKKEINEILHPKNQLKLYGYDELFLNFDKLYKKNKLPNSILLSGPKGIGKSTFIYHFSNYLLSKNEQFSYSLKDFEINDQNRTHTLINDGMHTNFYFLECNNLNEKVKVDQVRKLLIYANKSSFSQDLKILVIDNVETLNVNSANALLKIIEEPNKNIFFFIIQNNFNNILKTIKSRCIEFKISLHKDKKLMIYKNLSDQYNLKFDENIILEHLNYESPGNLINYILSSQNINFLSKKNSLNNIFQLIKKIEIVKKSTKFVLLSYLIEKFYRDGCYFNFVSFKNFNNYFLKYKKTIHQINNMKIFNLNEKNTLSFIKNNLEND